MSSSAERWAAEHRTHIKVTHGDATALAILNVSYLGVSGPSWPIGAMDCGAQGPRALLLPDELRSSSPAVCLLTPISISICHRDANPTPAKNKSSFGAPYPRDLRITSVGLYCAICPLSTTLNTSTYEVYRPDPTRQKIILFVHIATSFVHETLPSFNISNSVTNISTFSRIIWIIKFTYFNKFSNVTVFSRYCFFYMPFDIDICICYKH